MPKNNKIINTFAAGVRYIHLLKPA